MPDRFPTRRTLLLSGAALSTAALGGCLGDGPDDADGEPSDGGAGDADPAGAPSALDAVPASAEAALVADVEALIADDRLRERLNAAIARMDAPVDSAAAAFDAYERGAGLDLRDVEELTLFAGAQSRSPAAGRFSADWPEADVRALLERVFPDSPTVSYADRTVYEFDRGASALAVLEEGEYVVGTREAVESAIDVETGAAEPVDGSLREELAATPAGPLRFAFSYPHWLVDFVMHAAFSQPAPVDQEALDLVSRGRGAYVVDGDDRTASVTVETDSADAATTLTDEIDAALAIGREDPPPDPGPDAVDAALVQEAASALSVEADGTTVTIDVADGELLPFLLAASTEPIVLIPPPDVGRDSGQGSAPPLPEVRFEFAYDAEAGTLSITHVAGDTIRADRLTVDGEGFAAVDGVDMDGAGVWAGDTGGSVGGEPAVVAGDSVAVGVQPDYEVGLVWAAEGGTPSTLVASDSGPEA